MLGQGDPVEDLGLGHGRVVVGHDQELLLPRQPGQNTVEANHVRVIERGVDLVEHVEGTGVHGLKGEEEGQRGQRPLPSGEERQLLQALARRLRQDLHAGVERVLHLVLEAESGAAAREELAEELLEIDGHRLEDGAETIVDLLLQPPAQLEQLSRRVLQVLKLGGECLAAIAHLVVLHGSEQVDGAHGVELPLKPGDLSLRLLPIELGHLLLVQTARVVTQGERAAIDLGLRRLDLGHRRLDGVVRVSDLHLQGDIALLVLADLRLHRGQSSRIGERRPLQRFQLGLDRPQAVEPVGAFVPEAGGLSRKRPCGRRALGEVVAVRAPGVARPSQLADQVLVALPGERGLQLHLLPPLQRSGELACRLSQVCLGPAQVILDPLLQARQLLLPPAQFIKLAPGLAAQP